MKKLCGFAVDNKTLDGSWVVCPATQINGEICCHDISGFCGSWKATENAIFLESPVEDVLNREVMEKASGMAKELNKRRQIEY